MTPITGNLIESLTELVEKVEHNHRCVVCGGKLECDPSECIADENLVCGYCDGR